MKNRKQLLSTNSLILSLMMGATLLLMSCVDPVLEEAENWVREGGPDKTTKIADRPGTSGNLCVSGSNNRGHWLEWEIDIPKTGNYQFVLRYAGGRTWTVYRSISINGIIPEESYARVALPPTGGFGRQEKEWVNLSVRNAADTIVPLRLTKGKHTVRIENLGGDGENGSANLDLFALLDVSTKSDSVIVISTKTRPEVAILPNPADYTTPLTNSRVSTFAFPSKLLGGKILKLNVYLPAGYDKNLTYRTVYLLHGLNSDNTQWIPNLGIHTLVDELITSKEILPVILVAPHIEPSWGINSAPVRRVVSQDQAFPFTEGPYNDYVITEVIPFIETHFNTGKTRENRAIGGISMGGFAALHIAFSNPDVFSRVGGHASALRINPAAGPMTVFLKEKHEADTIHPRHIAKQVNLKDFKIWLDCGTEDPLIESNRELKELLETLGAKIEYSEGSGGHSQTYWGKNLKEYLRFYCGE